MPEACIDRSCTENGGLFVRCHGQNKTELNGSAPEIATGYCMLKARRSPLCYQCALSASGALEGWHARRRASLSRCAGGLPTVGQGFAQHETSVVLALPLHMTHLAVATL